MHHVSWSWATPEHISQRGLLSVIIHVGTLVVVSLFRFALRQAMSCVNIACKIQQEYTGTCSAIAFGRLTCFSSNIFFKNTGFKH